MAGVERACSDGRRWANDIPKVTQNQRDPMSFIEPGRRKTIRPYRSNVDSKSTTGKNDGVVLIDNRAKTDDPPTKIGVRYLKNISSWRSAMATSARIWFTAACALRSSWSEVRAPAPKYIHAYTRGVRRIPRQLPMPIAGSGLLVTPRGIRRNPSNS